MKKFVLSMLLLFTLTGCVYMSKFIGSSQGGEDYFKLSYKVLNISDSRDLTLKKGDVVRCKINNTRGKIQVKVTTKKDKEEVLSKEYKKEKDEFDFKADKAGDYTFSVSGKRAVGDVSFDLE